MAPGAAAFLGRDVRLADGLREAFRGDGWGLEWSRDGEGRWTAEISCPSIPHAVVGRGGSRVAAISRAHVAAVLILAGSGRHHHSHRGT